MDVCFLGSGDAFGSGGRFNSCFCVRHSAGQFLVDCGASSMVAIRKFGVDPNTIGVILITHLHGDHFGGLPFFLLDAQLISRRTAPLTIAGPPGLGDRLVRAMENFFAGSSTVERRFPLQILELQAETPRDIQGVMVTAYAVVHACGAPPFALRMAVDGKILCYSGDTEWVDDLVAAARGADLFIAESYFFEKQVRFHLDFATLALHLPEINAKRVILTHMSTDMLIKAKDTQCELAEDGKVISI